MGAQSSWDMVVPGRIAVSPLVDPISATTKPHALPGWNAGVVGTDFGSDLNGRAIILGHGGTWSNRGFAARGPHFCNHEAPCFTGLECWCRGDRFWFRSEWARNHPGTWWYLVESRFRRSWTPFLQPRSPMLYRVGMLVSWGPILVLDRK